MSATLAINPDPKPPADSTDVNPDPMSLYFRMDRAWRVRSRLLYGVEVVANAVGSEFSAHPMSGNVTTSARLFLLAA